MALVKEKIVIGINSLVSTVHNAYSNHIQLFFKLGRNYPQFDFVFVNPPRMSIDRMRNMTAEVALQCNAKFMIFIDDDVLVPFGFLGRFLLMVEQGYEIVCGNVMIRGYPFDYMAFQWDEKKEGLLTLKYVPNNAIIDLDAVGFSCALITVDLLRRLTMPFFITTPNMTEDVSFCLKVRDEFPATKMAMDTGIICGHVLWNEVIMEGNREFFKQYYENTHPQETADINNKESRDRGNKYLNTLKGASNDANGSGYSTTNTTTNNSGNNSKNGVPANSGTASEFGAESIDPTSISADA